MKKNRKNSGSSGCELPRVQVRPAPNAICTSGSGMPLTSRQARPLSTTASSNTIAEVASSMEARA
jgi:hypothetical protein